MHKCVKTVVEREIENEKTEEQIVDLQFYMVISCKNAMYYQKKKSFMFSFGMVLKCNTVSFIAGLMAVISQQLEYLCHAYHILQDTSSLYSHKGASKHDYKVTIIP